jgi:putative toxin-antitoxin system antitoxin component (TIGR02293 family)
MADTTLQDTMAMLGLNRRVEAPIELTSIIRKGLPFASFERLSRHLDISALVMGASFGLAKRTIVRRAQEKKLTPTESERLMRLARVFVQAKRTLGSEEKARRWILKPNRVLGNESPIRLLDTDVGKEAVLEELGRIEHGVFA